MCLVTIELLVYYKFESTSIQTGADVHTYESSNGIKTCKHYAQAPRRHSLEKYDQNSLLFFQNK